MEIASTNGEKAVSVSIPSSILADLPPGSSLNAKSIDLSDAGSLEGTGISMGSSVIDLTLTDANGDPLQFDGEIELCFGLLDSNADITRACLGYLDEEQGEWVCQDESLEGGESGEYCGGTSHFTNFALLLGATCGPEGCSSGAKGDTVIQWLSMGFACGGVLVVALGAVAAEAHMRYRRRKLRRTLRRARKLTASVSQTQSSTSL